MSVTRSYSTQDLARRMKKVNYFVTMQLRAKCDAFSAVLHILVSKVLHASVYQSRKLNLTVLRKKPPTHWALINSRISLKNVFKLQG